MRLTMLRVDATVIDRVKTYATDHGLSLGEAAADLLLAGLERQSARVTGGHARAAALSPEARRESARRAAAARWRK